MGIPQTSYALAPANSIGGMLADSSNKYVVSKLADAAIAAGLGVVTGAADGQIKPPAVTGDVSGHFQGIALYTAAKMPVAGSASEYAQYDAVPVLRKGRIWVLPQGDLVSDGPLYCVHTTGRFRGDNTGATLVPTGSVITGATVASGNCALVEINLP